MIDPVTMKTTRITSLLLPLVLLTLGQATIDLRAQSLPPIKVSENQRFLVTVDGRPFFWLADTAWQLIHDLDEAEMGRYFADRRDKGFTVIQTVALAELRFDILLGGNRACRACRIEKIHDRPTDEFYRHAYRHWRGIKRSAAAAPR